MSTTGSFLWYGYREFGNLTQAIEMVEEAIGIAEEMKIRGPQWGALVELASTFDWLGDFARGAEYAQRALASPAFDFPTPPMFPHAVLASVAMHQGDRPAAEEWLAPYPVVSFDELFQTSSFITPLYSFVLTIIELALAQGEPDRALGLAQDALASSRKASLDILTPSILHLQALALRRLNREGEAYGVLVDARQRAEAMQSRYRLLPILFTLIEMETERGDAAGAGRVRAQARDVINYIAAHTPEELRRSFLNLPSVHKVMTP